MANDATTPVNVLSWDDVKNSDAFQKLSGEQQEVARNQYFAQVVAPKVPTSALAEVRQLFDEDTGPGLKNWLKDTLHGAEAATEDVVGKMGDGIKPLIQPILPSVMVQRPPVDTRQATAATNGLSPLSKLGQDKLQEAAALAPEVASSMAAREGVIGDAAKMAVAEQQRRLDARAAGLPQAAVPTTPAEMGINAAGQIAADKAAEYERRQKFAQDNPHLSALASGQASFAQGALDAVPWAADTINAPINKALAAAGIDYQLPNAPRMPGAGYLQDAAKEYRTKAMDMTFDQMKTPEDFDNWLTQSLVSQAPQLAGSTAAAFLPKLRAAWLGIMGATTTGQKYQENKERGLDGDVARGEAAVAGAIEVLSEMLPLHVFDKIGGLIKKLPLEAQLGLLGRTISKTAAATGALAAQGATGAIEEAAAQLGQNASDRYLAGNTKITDLTQGVPEAAVLGAAMEGPMGVGHIANVVRTPEHSAAGFAEAFRRMVKEAQWAQPLDGKYDRPENTAPGAVDWTRQREVKADAAVPPAAEAKTGAAVPKQDTTGAIPAEQLLGAEVPDGQTPPAAEAPAAPTATEQKPTFDLGKLDRQQTTGPLTGTQAGPGFTAEDVLPKDKPFDTTLASNRAYNAPENAKIKEAWNQAHTATDADGNVQRVRHDHFETWHETGGVTMDVGAQFDAHGIAKTNPLGALLNLLQNGVNTSRRFDTAALVDSNNPRAAGGAYKDGPFIVLGEAGKTIADNGIKSVLVSDAVANVIPALQERFPNIDFIPYSQAQAKLSEKVAATTQPASQGEQDGQGQEGRRQEVLTGDGAPNPTGGTVAGGTTEGQTGEQQGGTQTPQAEQGQPQEAGQDSGVTETGKGTRDLPVEQVIQNGDDGSSSPWLQADGKLLGTGQDHMDAFGLEHSTYSDYMNATGGVRAAFFTDRTTGKFTAMLHTAEGQKFTPQQIETLRKMQSAHPNMTVMHGQADGNTNPEYQETAIDQLPVAEATAPTGDAPAAPTGDAPAGDVPTGGPKTPKAQEEITVDTPVGKRTAKNRWPTDKATLEKEKADKYDDTEDVTMLDGKPHIVSADGTVVHHYARDPEAPKKVILKEGFSSDAAKAEHESGQQSGESSEDPVEAALLASDQLALAELLYAGVAPVPQDRLPVIFAEDRLIRMEVASEDLDKIEKSLEKNKFRITDKLIPLSADEPNGRTGFVTVSAVHKKQIEDVGDVGGEMGYNRRGKSAPPTPLTKDATDSVIDKLLAGLALKNLVDINSNPEATFGSVMFKEVFAENLITASVYLANVSKELVWASDKIGDKQVIKRALQQGFDTQINLAAMDYHAAVTELQGILHAATNVDALYQSMIATYVTTNAHGRVVLSDKGKALAKVSKSTDIVGLISKYSAVFGINENSTDQTKRTKKKDADARTPLAHIIRKGMPDYRNGRDISSEELQTTFGLNKFNAGEWVNTTERQTHLNMIYDALMDFAKLSGIAPEVLGNSGRLSLAVGAQGRGGRTAAWFVPAYEEINLTKTKGDGSLAHEWTHALDHFAKKTTSGSIVIDDAVAMLEAHLTFETVDRRLRAALTNNAADMKNRNTPPKDAFFALIKGRMSGYDRTESQNTKFHKDSMAMDGEEGRNYWSTGKEMLARATEAFMYDASKNGSPYLVGWAAGPGAISKANGYNGTVYPEGAERARLNEVIKETLALLNGDGTAKQYVAEWRVVPVKDHGFVVVDQYGAGYLDRYAHSGRSTKGYGLRWYDTEAEATAAIPAYPQERPLTPLLKEIGGINTKVIEMANNLDKVMEELGIFKWPYIKDGSMAESMFYHLRQGWRPKDNNELKTYVAKAHKLNADNDVSRLLMQEAQQDFEAALGMYAGQRIDDLRRTGANEETIYKEIVKLYEAQPRINQRTSETELLQQFSTPLPLAYVAGLLGRVSSKTTVLEPTAGNGLLAMTANAKNVIAIELDERRLLNLKQMGFSNVHEGDAKSVIETAVRDQEVSTVLTNPPFGRNPDGYVKFDSWDGKTYSIGKLDHVIAAQALRGMADNGRAVLILQAPLKAETSLSREENPFFQWLYSNYHVADSFEVDGKLYERQGTTWPVRVIVIAGRRHSNTVFSPNTKLERVYDFEQLWSRYLSASSNSEQVVVGASGKFSGLSSRNQKSVPVPGSGEAKAGATDNGAGTGVGTGDGAGESGTGRDNNRPNVGSGAGQSGASADGDAGEVPGSQHGNTGGKSTGRGNASGTTGRKSGSGAASGTDVGGLSSLDLDSFFDENFGGEESKPKRTKSTKGESTGTTSGPRAPRAAGGTTSAPKAKAAAGDTLLDGLGLDDLLGDIENLLNGAPTETPAPKKTKAEKKEKAPAADKPAVLPPPVVTEPIVVAAPNPMPDNLLDILNGMAHNERALAAALANLQQATQQQQQPQQPEDKPRAMYSRRNQANDEEYANKWRPVLSKVWTSLSEKVADVGERIRRFVIGLQQKFGEFMRAMALRFLKEVQSQEAEEKRRNKLGGKEELHIVSEDNDSQRVYESRSAGYNEGIFVPRGQYDAVMKVLDAFEAAHGNIDDFVTNEMGYEDTDALHKALFGYQVDAVALAIGNLKKGNGFIIGDDTGVGKGRTAASILAWAHKNGKVPIFLTFNDTLYSAMYRDLKGIGFSDLRIGMTNTDGVVKDEDDNNRIVYQNKGKKAKQFLDGIIKDGKLPDDVDVLFTTYDQLGNANGNQRVALEALVKSGNAVIVMDESHSASGNQEEDRKKPEKVKRAKFIMNMLTGQDLFGKGTPPPAGWAPPGVVYLSGTFAKRADNMPIYVRTALRMAANSPNELVDMFTNGGNTMLMEASEMLVGAGSMIRRERSYAGVEMRFHVDTENGPRDARLFDDVTEILRAVIRADRAFMSWLEEDTAAVEDIIRTYMVDDPAAMAGGVGGNVFDTMGQKNTFTSVAHNVISQLLLATKLQSAIKSGIASMNGTAENPGGEKLVFSVQHTLEAAISEYAELAGLKPGDEMPDFSWRQILTRALNTTRRINVTSSFDPNMKTRIVVPYDYEKWPPSVKAEFDKALSLIEKLDSPLPASPLDALVTELQKHVIYWDENGYQRVVLPEDVPEGVESRHVVVGEVTGRSAAVDYTGEKPVYINREKIDTEDLILGFQNGDVDVLLLSSAGSTGLSAHADKKAVDQRRRHMYVLQPHANVSVFKQTLGRIHRTGQVEWPLFTMFGTDVPAERRTLAVARRKFKALSANTSAGSTATEIEAADFINMYGDKIVAKYLRDNMDLAAFMGVTVPESGKEPEDFALKISGKMAYLSTAEQKDFYDTVEQEYNAEIAMRDALGTNELMRQVLPLDAKLLSDPKQGGSQIVLEPGLNESNPFTSTALLSTYMVNILGEIPTPDSVRASIASALNDRTSWQVVAELEESLKVPFETALTAANKELADLDTQLADETLTEKARDDLQARRTKAAERIIAMGDEKETVLNALRNRFEIGNGFSKFNMREVEAMGVIVGLRYVAPKGKRASPYSKSAFLLTFQRNLPGPRTEVPLAALLAPSTVGLEIADYPSYSPNIDEWFAMRDAVGGRQKRYIATGNILRAVERLKGRGDIVKFTYAPRAGETVPREATGILMPQSYRPADLTKSDFTFRMAEAAGKAMLGVWKGLLDYHYAKEGAGFLDAVDALNEKLAGYETPDNAAVDEMVNGAGTSAGFDIVLSSDARESGTGFWRAEIRRFYPQEGIKFVFRFEKPLGNKDAIMAAAAKITGQSMYKADSLWKLEVTDPDAAYRLVTELLYPLAPAKIKSPFAEFSHGIQLKTHSELSGDGAMFSRTGKTKGSTVAKVSEWLAPAIAKMSNMDVRIVQSFNELPDNAAPSDVEGAWYSGMTVYLVADNLPSRRRAQGVLAHEAVGHAAMENMLGTHLMNNLVKEVNALGAAGNRTITALGKIVDQRQPGLDKNTRAREIVALMAENGVQHRVWRRIVQAVREWLRRQGFNIAFSDKDIDVLLRNAEKYAREGTPGVAAEGAAYSRRGGLLGYGQVQPDRKEGGLSDRILRAVGGDLLAERVTKPIYNSIKHIALERDYGGTVGEYVDTIRAGVVSNYGLSDEYLDNKHDMTVGVNRILREAMHITEQLKGLSRDESRVAYLWLNTKPEDESGGINQEEIALLAQLPQESRTLLMQVKNRIAELGQEAVDVGLLSQDTYDANKMAYLHRDYAKHVFGDKRVQELSVMRTNAAKVIGEQFRKRGMFFQIAPEKVVGVTDAWHQNPLGQKLIRLEKKASTGRVMKRVWLPEGTPIPADMADFEQDAAAWQVRELKNGGYYLWRDFTAEERQQMGELDEAKYGVAITMAQLAQDIESAKFFSWVADSYGEKEAPADAKVVLARDLTGKALDYADAVGKNVWVKVPDTQLEGTKLKKYGKLAGLYVPGPIWNDIRQIRHRPTPFGETYNKLMGMWKVAKTALSPMVHMNNIMANTFMADMHDVTPGDIVRAARFMYDWKQGDEATKKRNQDLWNRFEDSGATGGTFITSDLKTELLKPLLDQLEAEMNGGMGALDANVQVSAIVSLLFEKKWKQAMVSAMHTGPAKLPKKYIELLKWAYGNEDTFFRFAKFLQATEMGMSDREAGKASREAFLDYEINAPWVQNLRHTALPFVAFSYRMIPMAIDVAANKPWKIAKYMALTNLMVWAAMMGGGVDEKEWKRIKKLLPDDKVGKTPFLTERMIPIGKDKHGRTMVLDITRWVPLGDVFELRGDSSGMLPIWSPLYPAGPGMLLMELFMNKSTFTGDPIWSEADTINAKGENGVTSDMVKKLSGHVWKTMMPNHIGLPGVYATDKVMDAYSGATDRFGRAQSVGSALGSAVGVKVAPYDVKALRVNAMYKYKAADESAAVEMYKLANQTHQNKVGKEESKKKMNALLEKRKGLAKNLREKLKEDE